ncbi:MAG: carboxymuconolactone decarboxylase family protein [Candidatus Dormibacteria bacterium]
MSRIAGVPLRKTGPLTRLVLFFTRRKLLQLTGRETEGMLGPVEAYARIPGLLMGYGMFEMAAAKLHRVPGRLSVLAELKAATMTSCEYCIDLGSHIARRAGVSDAQLLALHRYRDSDQFSEVEKLVLDYAVGMSSTPVDVPDELFARLRRELNDDQIVELTSLIALENMRGRFNLALGYGSSGFSEGMVCAVPERNSTPRTAVTHPEGAGTP